MHARRTAQPAEPSCPMPCHAVWWYRYRDVADDVRVVCAASLGTCILRLPEQFLEAKYLKYLGWLLCDSYPAVRGTVLSRLAAIYRRLPASDHPLGSQVPPRFKDSKLSQNQSMPTAEHVTMAWPPSCF